MVNRQVKQVTCTKNGYRRQVSSKHTEWSAKFIPYTYFHFIYTAPLLYKPRTYNGERNNAAALNWSFTVINCARHKERHTDRSQNKAG